MTATFTPAMKLLLKEMGDKFRLGNLHQNTYEEIFGADVLLEAEQSLVESSPMCSDCGYQTLCGAIRYTITPLKATSSANQ